VPINVEIYYLLGIAIGCGEPTLASGVIVEPYNTTIVGSVIFYQCQQTWFIPSNASSVCEANGIWSSDPSQVVCRVSTVLILAGRVGVCAAVRFTFCSVIFFMQVGNFEHPLPSFTENFEVFS